LETVKLLSLDRQAQTLPVEHFKGSADAQSLNAT
jgi:hypothetical protein